VGRSETQAPLTVSPTDPAGSSRYRVAVGEFEITRRMRGISIALPEVTERPSHGLQHSSSNASS
jgi:hypothetical protein